MPVSNHSRLNSEPKQECQASYASRPSTAGRSASSHIDQQIEVVEDFLALNLPPEIDRNCCQCTENNIDAESTSFPDPEGKF